jgi:predicted HAD superfamily Cof-like phosphohydrolase
MQENIKKVREFHNTTGLQTLDTPGFLPNPLINLRLNILLETISDLGESAYRKDKVGTLEALVNLQYVLHEAVLEFGFQDVFEEACDEVHQSNMSKFTKTTFDAQRSIKEYQFKGIEAYYKLVAGNHIIMRTSDDKILNGIHFFEAGLEQIIENLNVEGQTDSVNPK